METDWILSDICSHIHGSLHGEGQIRIRDLVIDSRKVTPSADTMFVALEGEHHDGHLFIRELYQQGTRAFLVSRLPELSLFPDAGFCLVNNTLRGLQELAAVRRKRFPGPVAAITGSNGKTIVKEWIYQLMSDSFSIHRSPKSFNSQVGVPLSVWMIREHHDLALIEAGISLPGEMERLERIIAPDFGIFTNLGPAHQENFQSLEDKLQEKIRLFKGCGKIIFRADQRPDGIELQSYLEEQEAELIPWSLDGETVYRYAVSVKDSGGTRINARLPSGTCTFLLPFADDASIENALHAFTFAVVMGLPVEQAASRIQTLEPVSMRMEILRGINGCILVNDTYNSDIGGLSAALDLVNQHDQGKEKVLILSDLLESGMEDRELYQEISGLAVRKGITRFVGIGPALGKQKEQFPPGSLFFPSADEFLKRMDRTLFRASTILIKGSRKFGFERITGELQMKTHQTLLEIDLNAMVINLNYFRSLLKEQVKIMVMVKALSYGSGNMEIANLLQYHKVDYLAVAFIDEGVELRNAGIHLPIMVLNPDPSGFGQMLDYNLEPELYSFRSLEALYKILQYREILQYPVHIKLDTGMHRLGFQEEELAALVPRLKREEFRIASVFTHLAASDEPEHDSFSHRQIRQFDRITSALSEALHEPFLRHVLNSSGIERFPDAQYQMVRLGIGLHGIGQGKSLIPASSYRTTISQIRKVKKGDTIGYSRKGTAVSDRVIATLPVGYADGMDRRVGNGAGRVYIKGTSVPTIGEICMDMTMIDVTGLEISEGDEVEIFGKNLQVSEVARVARTIPYEILTSIPERVKRVYLQE